MSDTVKSVKSKKLYKYWKKHWSDSFKWQDYKDLNKEEFRLRHTKK